MEVRINNLTSNVHVADPAALLAPEVLDRIADAVLARLRSEERADLSRRRDSRVDRRATDID